MSLNQRHRLRFIFEYYESNPNKKKSDVVKYFLKVKFRRPTIYKTVALFESGKSCARASGSGKKIQFE